MAKSLTKRFRKCVTLCHRFLTPEDTHNLCVMCLGEEHMCSVLEGAECAHCGKFSMKKLRVSCLSLFSRDAGQASCGLGPSAAKAWRSNLVLKGGRCWWERNVTSVTPQSLSHSNLGLTWKPYVYNSYSLHFFDPLNYATLFMQHNRNLSCNVTILYTTNCQAIMWA